MPSPDSAGIPSMSYKLVAVLPRDREQDVDGTTSLVPTLPDGEYSTKEVGSASPALLSEAGPNDQRHD